jgi:hypothetical protein
LILVIYFYKACAIKSKEIYNFIDLKSIFTYETIEEIKEKEEKMEKKNKRVEKNSTNKVKIEEENCVNFTKPVKKRNISEKKNLNYNNRKIDKMFFTTNSDENMN